MGDNLAPLLHPSARHVRSTGHLICGQWVLPRRTMWKVVLTFVTVGMASEDTHWQKTTVPITHGNSGGRGERKAEKDVVAAVTETMSWVQTIRAITSPLVLPDCLHP